MAYCLFQCLNVLLGIISTFSFDSILFSLLEIESTSSLPVELEQYGSPLSVSWMTPSGEKTAVICLTLFSFQSETAWVRAETVVARDITPAFQGSWH